MGRTLGDILLERGVIDESGLAAATAALPEHGGSMGKALLAEGLATERQLFEAIAVQVGLPVDPSAASLLPRDVAREVCALPVAFGDADELIVAVADPNNQAGLQRVADVTGLRVSPALAVRNDLLRAIEHLADDSGETDPASSAPPSIIVSEGNPRLAFEDESLFDLNALLIELKNRGGSDLHLTAGVPPSIRVHGELVPLENQPILTPDELQKMLYGILTQKQREKFENELELDMSYQVPNEARYRVNIFQQRDSIGSVMRIIPFDIVPIEKLGVPAQITNFAHLPRGFVLVTGPTGSGKSTTLASLIDVINTERAAHIMTVEDPIEFLHKHKRSVVNQREVGTDTHGFHHALKHVLRQDPDVILVGEMRDLETIQIALTAAETGHLVFGTLHTQDAPQTVDRIVDVFPPEQQEQIRVMLSGALQGVVCQQLLKTPDGNGRVVATEVMIATSAIKNLIREGKTHQMYSMIQAGKQHGMVTMDQSLADLVLKGRVAYTTALERCNNVADFNRLCGRA
jgi:twitching motility protein PilT